MDKTLAVFDLDGTLSKNDTMISFLFHVFGRPKVIAYFVFILPLIFLMLFRIIKIRFVKELLLTHFFGNMQELKLRDMGNEYATTVLPQLMYKDVYTALNEHRQKGHDILLLTAACDVWTELWCVTEGIIFSGSRLQFSDGKCTGKLDGENCFGIRKKQVLEEFLKEKTYGTVYAYGNERADRFYMNMAQSSFKINKGKLIKYHEVS